MENRRCQKCGKEFKPMREWQKFCSTRCTTAYHTERTRLARKQLSEKEEAEKESQT
jgi:predicted nucleic acid-binding Zn ribbon protein